MKKLLLLALVLNLCPFLDGQAQSQTTSQKRPKFSPHSKRAGLAKPPHSWLKKMEGDSLEISRQDEKLRNSLPPHLRGMKNLPPHILAERQWLLQSEAENAEMEPNDLFNRLYPLHKQALARKPNPLQNAALDDSVQSFQSGATQILSGLSGGMKEAWVARYDEPSSYDLAQAIAVDAAGNVYMTGYSLSAGSSQDYLTVKYNAAGVQQWAVKYNGEVNGDDYAVALAVDRAGNVYVTGYSYNDYGFDYTTVKYNSAGIQEWVATYDGPEYGDLDDFAQALAVDDVGNVYVTGYSTALYYDPDDDDEKEYYVYATVKYNAAGTQEWVATDWLNNGNNSSYAVALSIDPASGDVYVTGHKWNRNSYYDCLTIKYNSAGQEQWENTYNGPGNGRDVARALGIDAAGNVYVAGHSWNGTSSDYATVKYNSAGAQEWVANYNSSGNGADYARALGIDAIGNVYVTGTNGTIKYSSAGKQEWVVNRPGSALAVDGAGNIYMAGFKRNKDTSSDYATVKYCYRSDYLTIILLD